LILDSLEKLLPLLIFLAGSRMALTSSWQWNMSR
jgi:hypothetical protein